MRHIDMIASKERPGRWVIQSINHPNSHLYVVPEVRNILTVEKQVVRGSRDEHRADPDHYRVLIIANNDSETIVYEKLDDETADKLYVFMLGYVAGDANTMTAWELKYA